MTRLFFNHTIESKVIEQKFVLQNLLVAMQGLCIRGNGKKFNEDSYAILSHNTCLQIIVVDGGTAIEPVLSLGEVSGGKYIADQVSQWSAGLDLSATVEENLRFLNQRIGENNKKFHSDILYDADVFNTPYGSIAVVKIDSAHHTIEVANAGDVMVLGIFKNGLSKFLTQDDVYQQDRKVLQKAKELAIQYGVTVKFLMENLSNDARFDPIKKEMYETMRLNTKGSISRITGSPLFKLHQSKETLDHVKKILILSDGAIPAGIDIHTEEGLKNFLAIIDNKGLDGLRQEIERIAASDVNFEKFPRFRYIDDMVIWQIELSTS